jgi:hypothetical protein
MNPQARPARALRRTEMNPLASLQYLAAEPAQRLWLRHLAAAALQRASLVLARSAHRLAPRPSADSALDAAVRCVEFHAEAGAPEGALYIDGQLVARLPGVHRL